jgi:hypothetical protein
VICTFCNFVVNSSRDNQQGKIPKPQRTVRARTAKFHMRQIAQAYKASFTRLHLQFDVRRAGAHRTLRSFRPNAQHKSDGYL